MARDPIGRTGALPRAARATAWMLAVASASLLAVACRDLVTDEVVDARTELCTRLEACALLGCAAVETMFAVDVPAEVDGFLTRFDDAQCQRTCGVATACLDVPGVCTAAGDPCLVDYLCCDATAGEAQCQAADGAVDDGDGECCKNLGVPCEIDAAVPQCCFLEGGVRMECKAPEEGGQPTCGGVPPCTRVGERCGDDVDCCSGTCVDSVCSRISCVPSGGSCSDGDNCCSEVEECVDGACGVKPCELGSPGCCVARGKDCAASPDACCEGLDCIATPDGRRTCGTQDCLPSGADCATHAQCECGGESDLACLRISAEAGSSQRVCTNQGCEPDVNGACGDDRACCAGLTCQGGACVPDCEPTACHDPGLFGPPLPTEAPDPSCEPAAACARDVCVEDPYCCCVLWDSLCVEQAASSPDCSP